MWSKMTTKDQMHIIGFLTLGKGGGLVQMVAVYNLTDATKFYKQHF